MWSHIYNQNKTADYDRLETNPISNSISDKHLDRCATEKCFQIIPHVRFHNTVCYMCYMSKTPVVFQAASPF